MLDSPNTEGEIYFGGASNGSYSPNTNALIKKYTAPLTFSDLTIDPTSAAVTNTIVIPTSFAPGELYEKMAIDCIFNK